MSNLLEQASLVMIPSGYAEDIVYSEIPLDGSGDMVFTRASNGTRINSSGLVEVCPWNLLEQSETIGVSPWQIQNCSVTGNTTTAPNGTTTAETLTEDTNTSRKFLYQNPTIVANQEITLTIYVKKNTLQYIRLVANDLNENFRWFGAQFDLTALTYTSATGSNGNATFTSASITDAGNGWYRIAVSGTINTTSLLFGIFPSNGATLSSSDDRGGNIYLGTGKTAYIWGAQLNIGSTAKPYFPTTDRLNVPRLTYQNGGGGCPSLLLEKQSTNLVPYSNDFTNAYWSTNSNAARSLSANLSPDGTANCYRIEAVSGTQVGSVESTTIGTVITTSIYVRRVSGSTTFYMVDVNNNNTTVNITSEWQRFSVTATATDTNLRTYFKLVQIGDVVEIYGAQSEASSYPTSYIPTTSASATRVADTCFKTGISSLIGQTEGTIFVDYVLNGQTNPNSSNIFNCEKNTTCSLFMAQQADGNFDAGLYVSGSLVGRIEAGSISVGQRVKVAYAYKSGSFVLYINGVQEGILSSTFTFPTTLDDIFLNDETYFNYKDAVQYNQVALFKTRLTNAELASLTTL